jgi:hypothetical protein
VVRWTEFESSSPDMAAAGLQLFTQYGVGLGFLATIRPDGGPRLHPMCPVFAQGGLYAFIVSSPKQQDLARDGRYAMHSFPPEAVDDEFCVMGRVHEIPPGSLREGLAAGYHGVIPDGSLLFEFDIERALLSRYQHRGDWPPSYTVWKASG